MDTVLQTIFWTVLWISYGAFSAYQVSIVEEGHKPVTYILFSLLAPVVLLYRILAGILGSKVFK